MKLEDLIESSLHWLPRYHTPESHVLADFYWLTGEWYPTEIDSAQYDTTGRFQHKFKQMTRWGMIPRGDWLCAVWYPEEIDSVQYHNPGRFMTIQISHRKRNLNRKYFNPLVSDPGWFIWWRSRISLDCPLKPYLAKTVNLNRTMEVSSWRPKEWSGKRRTFEINIQ